MTLRELARITSISPATISRVLNGNPNVSEENRTRVLEAVRETGYRLPERHPNAPRPILLAIYGRTRLWNYLNQSVSMEAKSVGYTLLSYCANAGDDTFRLRDFEREGMFDRPDIAGVLLNGVDLSAGDYKRLRARYPVVFCGTPTRFQDGCVVATDDYRATIALISKMVEEGGRRFAIIKAKDGRFSRDLEQQQDERIAAAYTVLCRNGLPEPWILEVETDEEAQARVNELAEEAARVDTIFCLHGMYVPALVAFLEKRGRHVPENIRVCSYDLNYNPMEKERKIWYVEQDFQRIGRVAVHMLDGLLHGAPVEGEHVYLNGRVRI